MEDEVRKGQYCISVIIITITLMEVSWWYSGTDWIWIATAKSGSDMEKRVQKNSTRPSFTATCHTTRAVGKES